MHIQSVKLTSALSVAVGTSDIGRQVPHLLFEGGRCKNGRGTRIKKRLGQGSRAGCWSAAEKMCSRAFFSHNEFSQSWPPINSVARVPFFLFK